MALNTSNLTSKERLKLWDKIDHEGFDYCFRGYSEWEEIKDSEFQKLREQYVSSADKLENYIARATKKEN